MKNIFLFIFLSLSLSCVSKSSFVKCTDEKNELESKVESLSKIKEQRDLLCGVAMVSISGDADDVVFIGNSQVFSFQRREIGEIQNFDDACEKALKVVEDGVGEARGIAEKAVGGTINTPDSEKDPTWLDKTKPEETWQDTKKQQQ